MSDYGNEILQASEWIVEQLESPTDATHLGDIQDHISGAYFEVIPLGAELPAVRFHMQSTSDVRGATNASARIMVNIDWLIVVVREGKGVAPLVPIAIALDQRLQKANGETGSCWVYTCVRREPFSQTEVADSGVMYRHAGGLYRTVVQAK